MMASSNPFRRKQMQILGLDEAAFNSSIENLSPVFPHSPDGKAAQRSRTVRIASPHSVNSLTSEESDHRSRHSASPQDDRRSDRSFSTTKSHGPASPDDGNNPFDEEDDEEDSLGELDRPAPRRRRTVPSKAGETLDVDHDNPWRTSTMIGNYPGPKKGRASPDTNTVPLKAQKTLGISRQGRIMSEEDYRRQNSLSPQTDNVAPKAQRMLGIPSNPFQKPQPLGDRQFFDDELERHGAKGPQRPMDVDEFKRLLLSGNRESSSVPDLPIQGSNRDSSSTTDVSSISHSSVVSQPESQVETPRSSHELRSRPQMARLTTETPQSQEFSRPLSPYDSEPQSATDLNKPLPPPPQSNSTQTFELAGSFPSPRIPPTPPLTRRYSQKVKQALERAGLPESIAELAAPDPKLPVKSRTTSIASTTIGLAELPGPIPGSEAMPIELPAREASPINVPRGNRSKRAYMPAKSAPIPPPPRRAGSTRSSLEEQHVYQKSGLANEETASDTSLPSTSMQFPKPPVPPARHSSTASPAARRVHRYVPHTLPLSRAAEVPRPLVDSPTIKDTNMNTYLGHTSTAPPPPPRRRGSSGSGRRPSLDSERDRRAKISPIPPGMPLNKAIPRLQTNIPSGTPIADSMISALSPADSLMRSAKQLPFSDTAPVSAISPTTAAMSPLKRRYSFGSITNSKVERLNSGRERGSEDRKIDVLADLGALQREVDALRTRFNSDSHRSSTDESDFEARAKARQSIITGEDKNNVIEQMMGSMNKRESAQVLSEAEKRKLKVGVAALREAGMAGIIEGGGSIDGGGGVVTAVGGPEDRRIVAGEGNVI